MSATTRPALLAVVGPTATGKTALAVRLAQLLGGEVLSADSVQVYRHFNIGSGKPSAEELELAPHHLLNLRDPLDPLEAKQWAELAAEKIDEIRARGALPIICGGTYLWVRALVYGLAEAPPGNEEIRARHKEIAAEKGRAFLHDELSKVDPPSAERLHQNDLLRVSRALEVFELTGKPLSELQANHGFREARYQVKLLGVDWERPAYEARLRQRVSQMLTDGFVDEVDELLARGYAEARAMNAVGYRQVRDFVEAKKRGEAVKDEDVLENIVRVTRIFARRQRTWLRDEKVHYIPSSQRDQAESLLPLGQDFSQG